MKHLKYLILLVTILGTTPSWGQEKCLEVCSPGKTLEDFCYTSCSKLIESNRCFTRNNDLIEIKVYKGGTILGELVNSVNVTMIGEKFYGLISQYSRNYAVSNQDKTIHLEILKNRLGYIYFIKIMNIAEHENYEGPLYCK